MPQTHITYCRNCPAVCGLEMDVENNKITDIRGDRKHRLTKGYLCVKGQTSADWQNGDDRAIQTTKRQSNGARVAIDVEQAMDEIHAQLSDIIAKHGPNAVAMYYGTGCNNNSVTHSAAKGWLKLIGSPYIFSSMTVDQSAKWVAIGRMGYFLTGVHSALDADVIMDVGSNPAISHTSATIPMTNPMQTLREQQKRGMKLISVDPRRTETARKADIHLQIKPGEDATLFAGMIRLLLKRGWHDEEFCQRFIGPLEPIRAAVEDFHLEYAAERAGVSADLIVQAVELFSQAKRKSATGSTGPNMSADSNTAEHLIEAFNALCGGYRRAGDIVRNVQPLFGRYISTEKVLPPYRSWEAAPLCRATPAGQMFGEYPSAVLPDEIMSQNEDRIRALIVIGGNPAKAIPDPNKTLAAFQHLELMVTIDPRPTDTMAISHYAIPSTLLYERHDYTGMYDNLYAHTFAQVTKPIVERPPGVIDDWEFFWGMARRMGKTLSLKMPTFGASHDQIAGPTYDMDMAHKPTTEDIIRNFTSRHLMSYEQLLTNPHGVLLDTTAIIEPAGEDDGARLELCAPDVAAEIAQVRRGGAQDPTFPYRLIVRRQLESMNSAYSNSVKTRRRYPTNPAYMNPEDMAETHVTNGDRIQIRSEHGVVTTVAQRDPGMRRGVISMSHGWGVADDKTDPGSEQGAYIGRLISLEKHLQPINYMPLLSGIAVAVSAAPSKATAAAGPERAAL